MATRLRQSSPGTVSRQAFPHEVFLTISDPEVQNGYEEALLPDFSECRIRSDLELLDAIRGLLTEIAEEDHLTELVLKRNTGFILGILSSGK